MYFSFPYRSFIMGECQKHITIAYTNQATLRRDRKKQQTKLSSHEKPPSLHITSISLIKGLRLQFPVQQLNGSELKSPPDKTTLPNVDIKGSIHK